MFMINYPSRARSKDFSENPYSIPQHCAEGLKTSFCLFEYEHRDFEP
jgi:hypothetical protein